MAAAEAEMLRAENARLTAERTSMKKKIMLAMKKQNAELKIAQQRAEAAEAALAAASIGIPIPSSVNPNSGMEGSASFATVPYADGGAGSLDSLKSDVSFNGEEFDEGDGEAHGFLNEIGRLRAELQKEREENQRREDGWVDEKQKLEQECIQLRETTAEQIRQLSEVREKLVADLRNLTETSQQEAEQLKQRNELLELQLESFRKDGAEVSRDGDGADPSQHSEQTITELAMEFPVLVNEQNGALQNRAERGAQESEIRDSLIQEHFGASSADAVPQHINNEVLLQEHVKHEDHVDVSIPTDEKPVLNSLEQQLQEARSKVKSLEFELQYRVEQLATSSRHLEEEMDARDKKYADLDAKFGRLLKRSKQRIQDVQKEKEDLEAQMKVAEQNAAALQVDLDRTRSQAGDALRTLDTERQLLTAALRRSKENMEELRHALEAKEHNLAESRRLASEKDQTVLEMGFTVKEAETNHEAAILELKEVHQKVIEGFELQLVDAVTERNKMDETLSLLQAQIAAKESRLADVEAASSGELVRLGAFLEAARGESLRLESEHKKEQEIQQSIVAKMKKQLEASELMQQQVEKAAAQARNELESELEDLRQICNATQSDLATARAETKERAEELAAYKVRAYALLQKKEAALEAAQDAELVAAQEAALQEAKKEAAAAIAVRDQALKALEGVVEEYQGQLDARAGAILVAEQQITELATKLESSKALLRSQQVEFQSRLEQVEESCHTRCETAEAKARGRSPDEADLATELTGLRIADEHLKKEFQSYQDTANLMMESKDHEISRLLDENASFQKLLIHQNNKVDAEAQESLGIDSAPPLVVAEQQILSLARLQAQREEEVTLCRRHIQALQEEIAELEHENRLHCNQVAMVKEEYRKNERAQTRNGVDMTYVKNVILKLLETGEVEALLPVIAMLLQFSPEEMRRCQAAYRIQAAGEVPLSGAAAVVDAASAAPRSLLSKLTGSR